MERPCNASRQGSSPCRSRFYGYELPEYMDEVIAGRALRRGLPYR
ncbi:MAG: hypothetical protein WC709_01955 [Thermoleophilia bacterium]